MNGFAAGARRLPPHHATIRVPWHDGGWTGIVCARPLDNTSCLILPRIGASRRDDVEARCKGQRLDELDRADLPPCVGVVRYDVTECYVLGSLALYCHSRKLHHRDMTRKQSGVDISRRTRR